MPSIASRLPLILAIAAAGACSDAAGRRALADAPVAPDAEEADAAVDAPPGCSAAAVDSRIVLQLDPRNPEWVKGLTWVDSNGATTPNLASYGSATSCSGPNEQFGQLYGAPEGNPPYLVGGNTLATRAVCGTDLTITASPQTCDTPPVAQVPVTTTYHFYGGAQASQVRVTRTVGFDGTTPIYGGVGIRPYVPRLPISMFTTVIFPNAASTAVNSTGTCGGDCFTAVGATWSGRWFADLAPGSGLAMIVLRDPAMTTPVELTVNNDSNSASNLSSFVLLQPTGGWKAPITEIEYLCFADLTSWPQAQRDAATLPAGCGP